MEPIKCLLDILDYPDAVKGYENLKNYYIQSNRKQDAEVIEHLIQKRFVKESSPAGSGLKNANTNNNKE